MIRVERKYAPNDEAMVRALMIVLGRKRKGATLPDASAEAAAGSHAEGESQRDQPHAAKVAE